MRKLNQGGSCGQGEILDKPRVLIVDRSQLDGRILEELLRPTAEVIVKCNVWTAVKYIDSEKRGISAIFVEMRLLQSSSLSEHWSKSVGRERRPRIFVTYDDDREKKRLDLKRFGVVGSLRKPYDKRDLVRILRSFDALA